MLPTIFKVTVRATSILVTPGEEAMDYLDPLIDLMTYEDEFVEETKTLGFMYDKETDTLYMHKGVDVQYLNRLLPNSKIIYDEYHPCKPMKFEYEEVIPPRNVEQEDVINFIAGLNHHADNIDVRQIFLVKTMGFGKGTPNSTMVPTPTKNGFTRMGDLTVGDYAFDENGKPTKIIDIFELGERDIYELTFNDGRKARCTEDHMWLVQDRYGVEHCVILKDLINNYKVYRDSITKKHKNRDPWVYNYKIPVCKEVMYPSQYIPIDPWVLGCFIGNGCLRERVLTISSGTPEIPEKIGEIYGFTVKKNSSHNYSYTFHLNGKPILTSKFFEGLPEMLGKYSYQKYIPDRYLYNTPEIRLGVLQGLMDTDGSISEQQVKHGKKYQIMFTTTSDTLAKHVQYLLYSLGYSASVIVDERDKYTVGHCNTLPFRIPNSCKHKLFRLKRKLDVALRARDVWQKRDFGHLIIKDIQKLPFKEQSRCIKVENPSELYLTENFIVTHNTYCAGTAACIHGVKTLIIVHRDNLRSQWLKSLYNMNGLTADYTYEITSSDELYDIAYGNIELDYDVYLMTHATFRAGVRRIKSLEKIGDITKNLGIGLKIIDEAHLEFRDTLLMDFCFNVKRNLYLTATDARSAKDENTIFKHVFSHATFYKPSALLSDSLPKKWVEYISVSVNTHVKKAVYQYRIIGGRGMNAAVYGKWVIKQDKTKQHFKCCRDILKLVYVNDPHAKVLIFMPLIELCEEAAYFFRKELNYDESFDYDLNIKTINSSNSKRENEDNKRADVIVTTIGSCGTGTDIPGITTIISCSPFVSRVTALQTFGRIRYCGKVCQYYDIFDQSVPMDFFWLKSRRKKLKSLALNVKHFDWSE